MSSIGNCPTWSLLSWQHNVNSCGIRWGEHVALIPRFVPASTTKRWMCNHLQKCLVPVEQSLLPTHPMVRQRIAAMPTNCRIPLDPLHDGARTSLTYMSRMTFICFQYCSLEETRRKCDSAHLQCQRLRPLRSVKITWAAFSHLPRIPR
jgi:hypothetical protein